MSTLAWKLRSSDLLPRHVTLGGFFSDEEINKIKDLAVNLEIQPALVGKKNDKKDIRSCQIKWFRPNEDTIWVYQKLVDAIHKINNEYFNLNLYGIQVLQYTIYNSDGKEFYAPHRDNFDTAIDGFVRKLTFSIQLSDSADYEGGELVIDADHHPKTASNIRGDIVFFLSNAVHEAKPVTKGVRHVLVGWVIGPPLM